MESDSIRDGSCAIVSAASDLGADGDGRMEERTPGVNVVGANTCFVMVLAVIVVVAIRGERGEVRSEPTKELVLQIYALMIAIDSTSRQSIASIGNAALSLLHYPPWEPKRQKLRRAPRARRPVPKPSLNRSGENTSMKKPVKQASSERARVNLKLITLLHNNNATRRKRRWIHCHVIDEDSRLVLNHFLKGGITYIKRSWDRNSSGNMDIKRNTRDTILNMMKVAMMILAVKMKQWMELTGMVVHFRIY